MQNQYEQDTPNEGKLPLTSRHYFLITNDVISAPLENISRLAVFSFFSIKRGIDYKGTCSIKSIAEWSGRKPNRNKKGINSKIKSSINFLSDLGYIKIIGKDINQVSESEEIEFFFNYDLLKNRIDNNYTSDIGYNKRKQEGLLFAMVWPDEIEKIITGCSGSDIDKVLLVFSWARMKITLRVQEDYLGFDIEELRRDYPEAYNTTFKEISRCTGVHEQAVSRAIDKLEELELIHSERLPRTQDSCGNWHTHDVILCNYEKRETSYIRESGLEYRQREIANKKAILKKIYEGTYYKNIFTR